MRILDRYILRAFIKGLIISFVSLAGLYVVIDLFNNFEELANYSEQSGSFAATVARYYGPRILLFFDQISNTLALLAAVTATVRLQGTNELTAIMAGGIPKSRIVRPLIGAAVVVSLLAVANREWALPQLRGQLLRNAQNWKGERAHSLTPALDGRTKIILGGREVVEADRTIHAPLFLLPPPFQEQLGKQLSARVAQYLPADSGRPAGYLLRGVTKPEEVERRSSLQDAEGGLVLGFPADQAWLASDECFVATSLNFEQLAVGRRWWNYASTRQLLQAVQDPFMDYQRGMRVMLHARFVQPCLDLCIFVMGLTLVLSKQNRNMYLAMGLCIPLVATFLVFVIASHAFGSNDLLPTHLAAWLPLLVFGPLAYAMKGRWQ